MKRILVLLAVLLPLSWFTIGCGSSASTSSKAPNPMAKEETEKMAKMQYEMMKKMQQKR